MQTRSSLRGRGTFPFVIVTKKTKSKSSNLLILQETLYEN